MTDIRKEISKILRKWDMPTRQAAIGEIVQLFNKELTKELFLAALSQPQEKEEK